MYSVGRSDKPKELASIPQSSIGAPCPMLVAGEHRLMLAYFLEIRDIDKGQEDACSIVTFHSPYAHIFGPPNDEAFSGHPLASRGLHPYGVFEIESSSWLHALERMSSVHPYHRAEAFADYKHYIFTFHDSTFECIAKHFEVAEERGFVWSALRRAQDAV